MGALDDIRKMKAELDATIKKEGRAALKAEFKAFFDANPTIKGIRWTQYTPHFNDGEPCTFSVGEFRYRFADTAQTEGDSEDGFLDSYSNKISDDKKLGELLHVFEGAVNDNDVLLSVFGDHVQVTATRKGFDVEEHDHD